MSCSPAVEFESVSKRYVIRHQKTGYLKDRLTNFVRRVNPFARRQADETVEDFWALKDVSFRIQPGESVGIMDRVVPARVRPSRSLQA